MTEATSTGDPRAMRALAATLRKDSEAVAARAAWLARRVDRMKFEGPAADALRQDMIRARIDADRTAMELKEIANRLLSGAARVEDLVRNSGGAS